MDDYREDLAYEHTEKLTQWKRLIGTEGEAKARDYIYDQFTGLGIECKREPFTCSNFATKYLLRIGLLIAAIGIFLAAFLYMQNLILYSFILALILLALVPLMNAFLSGTTLGSKWGTQFHSENLIGYMKARNPNPKHTVFIMSHYDTKSQTYRLLVRIVLFVLGLFGAVSVILINLIFGAIFLITSNNYMNGTFLFILTLVFVTCLILLEFNNTGNNSVGATDNAAAVGVQMAVIRNLLDFPPENTDVYFLATSAEEIGLFGAIAYIEAHEKEFDKDNTYFLNLDVIGGKGKILIHTKYGLPPKIVCPEITDALLRIARERNLDVGTQYLPTGAMADHFPIKKRGFKTTWIQTGDRMVTTSIHSPKDNMNLITKESLRTAIILCFEYIQEMDKKS